MSDLDLAGGRAALAAALNAVDGITASATYRQIARKGEAVIRFAGAVRDTSGFGYIVTWQALVALPSALKDAEVFIDGNVDGILTALEAEVVIADVAPVQLQLDTGLVPALQVTGTRAA